ncbi:T9SS type A sorting domain-containing protein [Crocinitomicaceae bacterium]|nr:T9SS type A sorting domain-containing protein [Crocinitomicaceae bacterium]MDC0257165.1 T9SS type A sorting domain-containing protein [Crocinitomicaceae bacterium]
MKGKIVSKTTSIVGMILSFGLLSAGYTATKNDKMTATPGPTRSGGAAALLNQDRTGSPVSSGTCASCHSGGSFGTSLNIQVKDAGNNVVTSYLPGATYTVEYTVSNATGSPAGYAMQAVMLDAANNQAGVHGTVNSTNSQVSVVSGREYFEQQGIQAAGFFSVDWTAPNTGTGDVSIYGIGVSLNGNGGTSGDQASGTVTLILTEDVPTTIDFPGNPYCADATNPTPVITGEQGGSFSAPTGLDINPTSGQINMSGSTPGTYTVTYTGATETASFDVTINQTYTVADAATICANETFQFGTQTLTSANAGVNTQVFQASNGCDSTVNLTLTVLPTPVTQLSQSICSNETIVFNGQMLDASNAGQNAFTTTGTNGCDSTVELTLTVFPVDTVQISETICQGETFDFNGQILDASNVGLNTVTLFNTNGCDSIVELTLSVTQIDLTITPDIFSLVLGQSNANASYQWLNCDNNFAVVPNENNDTLNVTNLGNWAAEITVDGCVDTTACEVPIYMGIDEISNSVLEIYPNPALEVLYIKNLSDLSEVDYIQIVNLNGQQLWSSDSPVNEIALRDLVSGTYFLKVRHARGEDIVTFIKH